MRPAFVVFIALRLAAAADATIESYFPSGTKAVIGVRLRAISDAGLFQGVDGEIKKSAASIFEKGPLAGFDPLRDLDEVIIATTGAGEKPPAVAVLRGKFPVDQIAKDQPRYQGVPVIEGPQGQGLLAIIDE